MNAQPAVASQTRSFSTIFLIELWERFGYYGMAAILVLFMVEKLGFGDDKANLVWGAFTALVYAAPAIGGWIGDNVLGTRRTMPIGAAILAIGYLMLSVPTDNLYFLYASMGVVVVGNGLFKANAANMVRRIYEGDDAKIDSAFTLYYMAVNVGSTVSMLLTPWIKDHWGWHAGFTVCCAGLLLGLVNYAFMVRTLNGIGSPVDEKPVRWDRLGMVLGIGFACVFVVSYIVQHMDIARLCVYAAGAIVGAIFAYMIANGTRSERAGLLAAVVLIVETLLFFIFYGQMSTSLTLFALRNVDLDQHLFGMTLFTWSPGQYQALNPIWIMLLSPFLAWAYTHFGKTGRDLPIAAKFALGFVVVALGFFTFGISGGTAVNAQDIVVVHDLGLRPLFARRAPGQRTRPCDDRALRSGAHGRLHDGRVFRRHGYLAIPRQRRRRTSPAFPKTSPIRPRAWRSTRIFSTVLACSQLAAPCSRSSCFR